MAKQKRKKFKDRTPEHKDRHFFARYQTKYRRRREGKTDYRQRKLLLAQDRTRFNLRKLRLVVRRSNRFLTAQLVHYVPEGDHILFSASTEELPSFGLSWGLSSYAAAYALGLLIAQRYLTKRESATEELEEEVVADLGLQRITTGCNVLGVVKGAADAGLPVSLSEKRLPGSAYDEDTKEWTFDPAEHERRMLGAASAFARKEGEEKAVEVLRQVHEQIKNQPFTVTNKSHAGMNKTHKLEKRKRKAERIKGTKQLIN